MSTILLLAVALAFSPVYGEADAFFCLYAEVETVAGTGSHGYHDGVPGQFNLPMGIFSIGDDLFIADTYNNLLRVVDPYGRVSRVTGRIIDMDELNFPRGLYRDGYIENALFNRPMDAVVDGRGWIFIADSRNNAIRVIAEDYVFSFAGGEGYGHANGPVSEALFHRPSAIAIGPCGNFFVADTFNHAIRMIDTYGYVTTVAGVPGYFGHEDGASDAAVFNSPMGIAVSPDGTIFVADTGNHLIRVIEDGYVRTLAGTLLFPGDIEWEYEYSDFDDLPLGGSGLMFNMPVGLSLWGDILIVADSANHMIRGVMPCGEVFTLAGTGSPGHIDGVRLESAFHLPQGVYVRGDTLYIADTGNNVIRVISLAVVGGIEYEEA